MNLSRLGTALVITMLLTVSSQPVTAQPILTYEEDVGQSWRRAVVYLPKSKQRTTIDQINLTGTHPVVLFLHGCAGLYPKEFDSDLFRWAEFIADQGFIVIMPDSLARPDRIPNCQPGKPGVTGRFPKALQYRFQEIGYATMKLISAPWADQQNIFLMGHSEGGSAAARQSGDIFKGLIISGWTCSHKKNPDARGIHAPLHIPALAMAYTQDPFFHGKDTEGKCIDHGQGRNITQVDLVGIGHGTFGEPRARDALARFLSDHKTR